MACEGIRLAIECNERPSVTFGHEIEAGDAGLVCRLPAEADDIADVLSQEPGHSDGERRTAAYDQRRAFQIAQIRRGALANRQLDGLVLPIERAANDPAPLAIGSHQ